MKIAMILPSLAKTGPGIVANDLCREYIKLGHQCKIFYFDNITGLNLSCPSERISFTQEIEFDKWDIIHSHMLRPDAYVWFHKAKIKRAKTVTTLHNPITYKAARTGFGIFQSLMISMFWNHFIKSHDWIICLNSDTLSTQSKSIKNKSSVIFNGRNIDKQINSSSTKIHNDLKLIHEKWKVIGSISSLTKRKGIDQAIRGLVKLPDYFLIVIGDGPEKRSLENLAIHLNVRDRIYFTGFQDRPTDFLSYLDLFIMCSESEGFPLALIEAAAYGKPAILSDISILRSIITTSQGAAFYKLYDIEDFAKKVYESYEDKDMMGKQILKYYEQNLTADIMAKNYLNIYHKLYDKK